MIESGHAPFTQKALLYLNLFAASYDRDSSSFKIVLICHFSEFYEEVYNSFVGQFGHGESTKLEVWKKFWKKCILL